MAAHVTVQPGQLGALIRRTVTRNAAAVQRGIREGARRGAAYLASKSPVFQGVLKNAWEVQNTTWVGATKVINTSPYAGIIERGARPHHVSRAGIEAIREWVRRKLLVGSGGGGRPMTPAQASHSGGYGYLVDEVTWAVVKKIERHGVKGHFMVRNSLPLLTQFVNEAITDALSKANAGTP